MVKRHTGYTEFKHITKKNWAVWGFLSEQVQKDKEEAVKCAEQKTKKAIKK